ncbi:MAG: hypothetical protein N2691_04265, partial [Patescibacteria group bacterium]|nr:hypothetical protein [Patescibacteria group bacterium]
YKDSIMGNFADAVRYDIKIQSMPEVQVLPPYLIKLGEIQDEATRAQVGNHMAEYANIVNNVPTGPISTALQAFRMQARENVPIDDHHSTTIRDYLARLLNHPAYSRHIQDRAKNMLIIFERLMEYPGLRDHYFLVDQGQFTSSKTVLPEALAVLEQPGYYTRVGQIEQGLLAKQQLNRSIAEFYSAIEDATDPQQVEALLNIHLPDFYATLTAFKDSLGTDPSGENRFDAFINKVASQVEFNQVTLLNQIDELLIELCSETSSVTHLALSSGGSIQMVLPLLVVTKIRSNLYTQKNYGNYTEEYVEEKEQILKQRVQDLKQEYTNKYCLSDDYLDRILMEARPKRIYFETFKNASQITDQEISQLIQIADKGELGYHEAILSIMLSLLYFEKTTPRARKSMETPAFKELLKAMYPKISDEQWNQYWNLAV